MLLVRDYWRHTGLHNENPKPNFLGGSTMDPKQIDYYEFIHLINPPQVGARVMIKNTSQDREFWSAEINGEWFHGFNSKEQAERI